VPDQYGAKLLFPFHDPCALGDAGFLCEEEAAPASRQLKHRVFGGTAASAGIGPATADKILQARKSYGKFESVNDLEAIRGIGPKKLDKMKKYLTVGAPAPPPKKPTAQAKATAKAPPAKNPAAKPTPTLKTNPATVSEDQEP